MKKFIRTRLVSLILALLLTCTLCAPASASQFTDVPETHWAYNDIMECANQGIVTGYADGSFLPNETVTAVQFLVMLTRTFYSAEVAAVAAPAGQPWYYPNTKVAADTNMSTGLAATDIDDTKGMTRYNMALVIANTLIANGKGATVAQMQTAVSNIKDITSAPSAYRMSVLHCYAQGILTGMSDGTFSGEESMTRAQACTVIIRMMNLIQGTQPTTPAQPQQPAAPEQPAQPEPSADAGVLSNGQPATPENVSALLDQIKLEYPDGSEWSSATNYDYTGYTTELAAINQLVKNTSSFSGGCGGFAAMISDNIFGHNMGKEVTSIADVRPGDMLFKYDSSGRVAHIAIVLYTRAPYTTGNNNASWCVYCASGNMNGGYVVWEHTYDINSNCSGVGNSYTYRFITRY